MAGPKVSVETQFYDVDALTAAGIEEQIRDRGPKGFWAFTNWQVRWSGFCRVSVAIVYTMPRHLRYDALPTPVRRDWAQNLRNLKAHEAEHGKHAIAAGEEVKAANCKNAYAIVAKYNRLDEELDKRTNHGTRPDPLTE